MNKLPVAWRKHRNALLAGAAGIVLVALVVVLVIGQDAANLLGTAGSGGLNITPANPTIGVGGKVDLKVDVGSNGNPKVCRWDSSDLNIASVLKLPSGDQAQVEGRQQGQATITVSCGGMNGSTNVKVGTQGLTITPSNPTVEIQGTLVLKVDLGGQGSAGACRWTSDDLNIANVTKQEPGDSALVEGRQTGQTKISVSCGAMNGVATVTVK